jgi:hypothetical protein
LDCWEPSFTFHGFRYLQVDGWTGSFLSKIFLSLVLHTDMEQTGWSHFSHPLINRLHENVLPIQILVIKKHATLARANTASALHIRTHTRNAHPLDNGSFAAAISSVLHSASWYLAFPTIPPPSHGLVEASSSWRSSRLTAVLHDTARDRVLVCGI